MSVRGLRKTYGSGSGAFEALRGVDLDVAAGESLAILGKSGSGKSTLMHLLALLDRPTAGSLTLEGVETSRLKVKEVNATRNRAFGFVFQQFFLNPRASVLDNVVLPLTIAGVPRGERRRRGMAALAQLGLDDKASNKANDLSGGQKQRVVIARALINEPRVIFADEPTGNLDSTTGGMVEDILFDLHRERGITLVVVTHDEDLAARCDRSIQIRDGLVAGEQVAA
ncbi:ABC transporter ATP-binding protein [Cellulomonas sp. SLBN-39]|uniref:ABC transporter ATP-binding protein n=1 Tax=Cellulomonas sp. SLBN-39 TaxID=2768446 RepID=UPI001152E144|nr:ABC transporter ATP-binding protein [Cellulomonas sp. SLBN-39]TQL02356.1 putative ABC transport system ATP-binding protein [Cellulomonas sp. SLBN-39]